MSAAPLVPDRSVIATFVDAIFRHANPDSFVVLKAFDADNLPVIRAQPIAVRDPELVDRACAVAQLVAQHRPAAAFNPAAVTFCNSYLARIEAGEEGRWSAREEDVADGLAIQVDADKDPVRSRERIVAVLGRPTVGVASGGLWLDPETGELQPKTHQYWRLSTPARSSEERLALRQARDLACLIAGSDATAASLQHGLRWPGTWHTKAEPRLATLTEFSTAEVSLADALARLVAAAAAMGVTAEATRLPGREPDPELAGDPEDVEQAVRRIPNADLDWAAWKKMALAIWGATKGEGEGLFFDWSLKSCKCVPDEDAATWDSIRSSPPKRIGARYLYARAREADPAWRPPSELRRLFEPPAETDAAVKPWAEQATRDDKGRPIPNVANTLLVLRNVAEVAEAFAFDEMTGMEMLVAPIPAVVPEPEPFGGARALRDTDYTRFQEFLQRSGLPRIARDAVFQAVDLRARERSFHPIKDYLRGLSWDGVGRLDDWLAVYLGAERTRYAAQIGRMFLIAMTARVFKPGCKSDYMLVLEGIQGTNKSMVCEILAGEWFSDSMPELHEGKDVAQHLNGKWLIEVGEMSAMTKADSNLLKAFIVRKVEKYRPSYGRKEVVQPRQCLFIGTSNESLYLRDETGGRRFWPVKTTAIESDALRRDRDQLFAEAVVAFRAGEDWWPSKEFEAEQIVPQQESRYAEDALEEPIRAFLAERSEVLVGEVGRGALALTPVQIDRKMQLRITAALHRLGWRRSDKKDRKGNWPWRPTVSAT